jgi:hypothetical protein
MTEIGDVVVILASAYATFVAMVAFAVRRPVPRPRFHGEPVSGVPVRQLVGLAVGGYVAFLVIVLLFHVLLVGQEGALRSAAAAGAFLLAVAAPALVLLWWLETAWSRRRPRG